eukprot:Nk52_evm2s335 gene=Nk52_evmTU2s335
MVFKAACVLFGVGRVTTASPLLLRPFSLASSSFGHTSAHPAAVLSVLGGAKRGLSSTSGVWLRKSEGKDVAIIGGGIMGCSTAYFLKKADPSLKVCVVERDSSYEQCSTALSVGSIRLQFSNEENIKISQFGVDFIRHIDDYLRVDDPVDISFRKSGYMFLATPDKESILRRNTELQSSLGADTRLLDIKALKEKMPWINTDGISLASLGKSEEGWFDPYLLLSAFRTKAKAEGVEFIEGTCHNLKLNETGSGVESVQVLNETAGTDDTIAVGNVVNCAGPYGAIVASYAGISLPIDPRKRYVFIFNFKDKDQVFGKSEGSPGSDCCPMVIDTNGVYFRPEGNHFICGVSPEEDLDLSCQEVLLSNDKAAMCELFEQIDYSLFETVIWPTIANRVSVFNDIKVVNAWMGLYDYNTFDQNAIVGPHPGVTNFYLCNGFSGHGIQQAPGIGRALSEHILTGDFRTINLSRMGYDRITKGNRLLEVNVV